MMLSFISFLRPLSPSFLVLFLLASGSLQGKSPFGVEACGGVFPPPQQFDDVPVVQQTGVNIAFGVRTVDDSSVDVDMTVQINYEGSAEDFAWIVPVPAKPKLSLSSEFLFLGLSSKTNPYFKLTVNDEDTVANYCNWSYETAWWMWNDDGERNLCGGVNAPPPEESDDIVSETGSVGPFEFVVLEASINETSIDSDGNATESQNSDAIFDWLNANGYAQPENARTLINYYSEMGMQFVALRLQSDSSAGDIRPVTLSYRQPIDLKTSTVARIPIELTSIAANPEMPIQIYLLGPHRGAAYNYADVKIDYNLLDWWGCQYRGQACYMDSYKHLFYHAAKDVNGHAMVTEYAAKLDDGYDGNDDQPVVDIDNIKFNISVEQLSIAKTPYEFLQLLKNARVPATSQVHSIIVRYIPNRYNDSLPEYCSTGEELSAQQISLYNPENIYGCHYISGSCKEKSFLMKFCSPHIDWGDGIVFDPQGLASELNTTIFQPAKEAQDWVRSYNYITRLYAQLDPEQMDKDPVFAFLPNLPDVPRDVDAYAVPFCEEATGSLFFDTYIGVDQYSIDGTDVIPFRAGNGTSVDGGCSSSSRWYYTAAQTVFDGTTSSALYMTKYGFPAEEDLVVFRDSSTGFFKNDELQNLISRLDQDPPSGGATRSIGNFLLIIIGVTTLGVLANGT